MEQNGSQQPEPTPNATPEQRIRAIQEQIQSYYSNCAMLATTPLDVSVYFGRLIPVTRETGDQGFAEYYEKQIILTLEQARKIGNALLQTVNAVEMSHQAPQPQPQPQIQPQPQTQPLRRQAPAASAKAVRSEAGARLSSALITNESDLEIEIPLGDLHETRPQPTAAAPRAARPALAAQAAGAPRKSVKVEV